MVDQAHRYILDREASFAEVQEHLGGALDLVREVVDYGSNLLVRCLGGTTGEILDVVAIGVFGKQAVAALDAVEQLSRTRCAGHLTYRYFSDAPLRGAFDVTILLGRSENPA
jgi:hypothetical protein